MASVIKRRLKSGIAYYGKYDAGTDAKGKTIWKMIPTNQPSRTKAATWIDHYEKAEKQKRENPEEHHVFGALADMWLAQLSNRSAETDRVQFKKHVLPHFKDTPVSEITSAAVTRWAGVLKAAGKVPGARFSGGTQRKAFGHLSRFLSWCVANGYARSNACRDVGSDYRPQPTPKTRDEPWIADDSIARKLISALASPTMKPQKKKGRVKPIPPAAPWFGFAFYLANTGGMRLGEVCGLRIGDMADLDKERVRVAHSYDGPLKEDRGRGPVPKEKWAPAGEDGVAFLAPWLARRRAEGAGPTDYLFPPIGAADYSERKTINRTKRAIERAWEWAAECCGIEMTWYQGSRHSFTSRNLSRGASLDEVASALGHSSPVVTKRYYDHFIRKNFSATLTAGLGLTASTGSADVIDIHGAQRGAPVESEKTAEPPTSENRQATR